MPLSINYDAAYMYESARHLSNEVTKKALKELTLKRYLNLACTGVVEQLSGAELLEDYGDSAVLSNAAVSSIDYSALVSGATYTEATKTITKTAHGKTISDVGKQIVFFSAASKIVIDQIKSITDVDNFVVTYGAGVNMSSVFYGIYSRYSLTYFDISAYNLDRIRGLNDASNGVLIPEPDYDKFYNLSELSDHQSNIFWNQHGQSLRLYVPSGMSLGVITMDYFRSIIPVVNSTDKLDVRDKYVDLVLDKMMNYIYQHLEKYGLLKPGVDQKTLAIRQQNLLEKEMAKSGKK